jgi:hypothetical protein
MFSAPQTSIGILLAMVYWYSLLFTTYTVTSVWEAFGLTSFRLFYLLLVMSLLPRLTDAVQSLRQGEICRLVVRASALLLLIAVVHVYLYRVDGTFALVEAEPFQPVSATFIKLSRGPLAKIPQLPMVMSLVEPDGLPRSSEIIWKGRSKRITADFFEQDGVRLRYIRKGIAPFISVTKNEGTLIEESFVKLDLDTLIGQDSFMLRIIPFEFVLRRATGEKSGKDAFQLDVRSGKVRIAEGVLKPGGSLKVADVIVSMKEMRNSGVFEMSSRPGIRMVYLTSGLFILALGCRVFSSLWLKFGKTRGNSYGTGMLN